MKITKGTIIRTAVLLVAVVNHFLVSTGHSVLPIDETEVELIISDIFMYGSAIVTWWKNNSFTLDHIQADAEIAAKRKIKG